jgi:hypothetical protein
MRAFPSDFLAEIMCSRYESIYLEVPNIKIKFVTNFILLKNLISPLNKSTRLATQQ